MNAEGRSELSGRLSRWGEWLLAAAFVATPMTSIRLGESVTAGDLLLGLAAVLALALLALRPRNPLPSPWIWAGGALLALSILVVRVFPPTDEALFLLTGLFDGLQYGSSFTTGARLLVAAIVLPVVVSIVVSRWSAIDLLARAFILGVSLSSAVAVLDAYTGTSIQADLSSNPDEVAAALIANPPRYVGLTGHPNILSITTVLCLPLVLGRMTSVKRFLLNAPLVVLFLIAILVSGSRAGLVGFAVVVVLSLALNPRVRSVALSLDLRVVGAYFAGLAVVVLLAFVVPVQQVLVPGIPADEQRQLGGGSAAGFDRIDPGAVGSRESDSIRRQYIDNSIEFIRDRPAVGYGFQWIETSHNIYLQLLISGGVLALIGFLLVIFGYLREAWRIRSTVSGPWLDLLTALVVSVLAYLVMGLVSPDIVDRYVYVSAALILAMAVLTRSGIALPGSDGQPESAAGPASAASPEPSSGSGTAVAR